MKAIMVMFDSLNRRMLPPYGCEWTHAPNFERLAERTITFDTCYAGSMPCMPARREFHTGRYNFLHRSWGPLEPFDDSVPELLSRAGVHTHLSTDHQHYWEDGGATYHTRYSTFELFRGQEGDPWKAQLAEPDVPEHRVHGVEAAKPDLWRQDWVNRTHMQSLDQHSQTLTFDAGIEFLRTNGGEDRWFLQIETFDPHEPFFSYAEHKRYYDPVYSGPHFDWPNYARVAEAPDHVARARDEYAALLTMCDSSLGRVLDYMDEHGMWQDTMLIVCTDHGFLLGEHGWWGKTVQPWYDETIHTPLFIWDPREGRAGERQSSLVQTIDIGPTLLDFFDVERTPDMQGAPLRLAINGATVRDAALFGVFGGHVCVADGRYVYMRAPKSAENQPLFEHTLMPTHMKGFFGLDVLREAVLSDPFTFTKGTRLLKTPSSSYVTPWEFGTLLFDLHQDPGQNFPLKDDELERRMATLLRDLLVDSDTPIEQYERLGLPPSGPITDEHLLIKAQWNQIVSSTRSSYSMEETKQADQHHRRSLAELLADPTSRAVLDRHAPMLVASPLSRSVRNMNLVQLTQMVGEFLPKEALERVLAELPTGETA